MKPHFIIFALVAFVTANAQVGIGTSTPNESSILDIVSDDSGILIPRIVLSSTTTAAPITNPVEGLLLYNTSSSGDVTPGLYYWSATGTEWKRVTNDDDTAGGSGWALTGNTIASTNFIGSLNNQSLILKTNNTTTANFSPNGSVRLGFNTSTLGSRSFAIGQNATSSADGAFAIGEGSQAKTPYTLVFGGYASAESADAIAIGNSSNANKAKSMALGYFAAATGERSIAFGRSAASSGQQAVAVGSYSSATGVDAIAIGTGAQASGLNATAIGLNSRASRTNSMALGNGATATADNTISIGNTAISAIRGQVTFTTYSDGRFKYDVHEDVPGLEFIQRLRPVVYKFNREKLSKFKNESVQVENTGDLETGFIAQEVEKVANDLGYEFNGINKPADINKDGYSLSYSLFVVPLVKAVQEQQVQIELLKEQVKKLQQLEAALSELKAMALQKEVLCN